MSYRLYSVNGELDPENWEKQWFLHGEIVIVAEDETLQKMLKLLNITSVYPSFSCCSEENMVSFYRVLDINNVLEAEIADEKKCVFRAWFDQVRVSDVVTFLDAAVLFGERC